MKYISKNNNLLSIIGGGQQLQQKVLKKINENSINKKEINSLKNIDAGVNIIGVRNEILQILVSHEYRWHPLDKTMKHQISTFGGKHEEGETILQTAIRETIEEIFNIIPKQEALDMICEFINSDSYDKYYYIIKTIGTNNLPYYSYIFDVNILGKIIDILIKNDHKTFPRMPNFYMEYPFGDKDLSHVMLKFNEYILPPDTPSGIPKIKIEELIYDRKMADKIIEKLSRFRTASRLLKLTGQNERKIRSTNLFSDGMHIKEIETSLRAFDEKNNEISGLFETTQIDYHELGQLITNSEHSVPPIYKYFKQDLQLPVYRQMLTIAENITSQTDKI